MKHQDTSLNWMIWGIPIPQLYPKGGLRLSNHCLYSLIGTTGLVRADGTVEYDLKTILHLGDPRSVPSHMVKGSF